MPIHDIIVDKILEMFMLKIKNIVKLETFFVIQVNIEVLQLHYVFQEIT